MKKGPFGKFARRRRQRLRRRTTSSTRTRRRRSASSRSCSKDADELFLATDEDREGEAIAWHLLAGAQAQGPGQAHGVPRDHPGGDPAGAGEHRASSTTGWSTRRRPAASSTGCTATRSRPVLWRKVRQGLSAGRVQSVATRLVVERERERMAFRRRRLLGRHGHVRGRATVTPPTPRRSAPGSPRSTGAASPRAATSTTAGSSRSARASCTSTRRGATRLVAGLDDADVRRPRRSRPSRTRAAPRRRSPPRRCSRRRAASCGCRRARRCASRRGCTRTATSPTCVPTPRRCRTQAIDAARRQAAELYGAEYVPDAPRVYASKAKGAQEAHEAIRPAGDHSARPAQVAGELTRRPVPAVRADLEAHGRLADGRRARARPRRVRLGADGVATARDAVFSASGTVITFRGFLAAYEEGARRRRTTRRARRRPRRTTRAAARWPRATR